MNHSALRYVPALPDTAIPATLITIGLLDPSTDRPDGRIKPLRNFTQRMARAMQLDHLVLERLRVPPPEFRL